MAETLTQKTTPSWFSTYTGIYSSLNPPRTLPKAPSLDLVSFLFSHGHGGHSTALVDFSSSLSISYQQLQEMVLSLGSGLQSVGVSKGNLVLLLLPNSVFFPVILLGVLSIGAVVTAMNPLSSQEEIKKQIDRKNPVLAFTSIDSMKKINGFGFPAIAVPVNLTCVSNAFDEFFRILYCDSKPALRPEISQTDIAAILYSSGTSGASKGVVLTHANLITMVELFVRFEASQYEREGCQNVYLAAIPMFHVYGLSLLAIGLLSLGSKVVVMNKFVIEDVVKAIDAFRVTHFPVVPPILGALIRAQAGNGCKLSSLIQVSSGAAPLSKKIINDFLKSFPHVDLIQGYGMTESTAVGTRGFNSKSLKKHTSVGLLAPNMQAKVISTKTGSSLPPGNSGELLLRGPAIMKGYLNDENATKSAIDEDGWLKTGDIAYFDQDGYLHVLDRLKDTIKYNGFQIAPADLEALLISHPEILDVAVTSAEDEDAGEIPVAFVVRVPGSTISSDEVITYVAKRVSPYKKVRRVVFVQSIPRSPAGKILRSSLRNSNGGSRL
ncbi:putative AMP-dependent synthetase/ligase, AMP-binding, AMP-binding enzyme domain, ANL [Dioscorea sansibarensis]